MSIKIEVIARMLRIEQARLEAEVNEGQTEAETLEQAIEVHKNIWK